MKRRVLILLSTVAIVGIGLYHGNLSQASEVISEVSTLNQSDLLTEDLEVSTFNEDGDTIFFSSPEDLEKWNSSQSSIPVGPTLRNTGGEHWKPVVQSSERKNNHFINYHSGTPGWARASSYTLTTNKAFNVSGSYKSKNYSVNIGFSYSKSVATTIPADSSKDSRLGVYGDFTFSYVKYEQYVYGKKTGKVSYGSTATRHSYTVKPKYK